MVQAAIARLKTVKCLEALLVPSHCDLMGNKLADENSKLGSIEHQYSIELDPADRRALVRRAYSSTFNATPLHGATYTHNPFHQEVTLMSKFQMTDLHRFRSGHHPHYDAGKI